MPQATQPFLINATGQTHDSTLFAAIELSKSAWLIAVNLPGTDKISKYTVPAADVAALSALLARLRERAKKRRGSDVRIVAIHEAGFDGFWVHRMLESKDVESHVVDAASIEVNRRSRRAKTDRIDVEKLLCTLMSWARGERRVCSMVRPPSPTEEDERRLTRERDALVTERTRHVNRIKGLLATQGVHHFEPVRSDRRTRLEALRRWDGQLLPRHLKSELLRELDRLELVIAHVTEVEAERDAALALRRRRREVDDTAERRIVAESSINRIGADLLRLRAIGPEIASVLSREIFFRDFANRREVAAYSGLVPSPWKSGSVNIEQGISKAGNRRGRKTMVQLAWLWLRHQPASALSRWFNERVSDRRGRVRRIAIVAMARKLLVALWRYLTHGIVPEGAALSA